MNQETEIISNLNSINVKLTKTNDQLEHLRWQSYDINTPYNNFNFIRNDLRRKP